MLAVVQVRDSCHSFEYVTEDLRSVGLADPYVTLTYSRLRKPLYSTRIIKNDCNPVFEETAVILVDVNAIRLHEKLSFQLWDSDRMSVVCIGSVRTHGALQY